MTAPSAKHARHLGSTSRVSQAETPIADTSFPPSAPSQPLPDHLQDTLKLPARSLSRLDDEAEHEALWDQTVRPHVFSPNPSRFPAHSRESSAEKLPLPTPSLTSPRSHAPPSRQALGGGAIERAVDPNKSTIYGHHRQTSIVHGFQHSRNGSVASSAGPLSPQMIAAAGAGLGRPDMQSVAARLEADGSIPSRPTTSLGGPMVSTSNGFAMERSASAADMSPQAAGQRKLEMMHGKSRRDQPSHQSHSSRHRDEQKTVGEYALHVLFTSVCDFVRPWSDASLTLHSSLLKPRRS